MPLSSCLPSLKSRGGLETIDIELTVVLTVTNLRLFVLVMYPCTQQYLRNFVLHELSRVNLFCKLWNFLSNHWV